MRYFLDLFSGIGGFALGAEWAGLKFDGHYYSDIEPYANKVYQLRFPDAIPLGDICKINGKDLPDGEWIIAGGFPCQDISVAGKGAGLAGARSGLWFEYARIIGELRPAYAIMENVGALTHRGLDAVLGSLAEIGYDAEWQDIRASDVGAPHRRERIWIVAYPSSEGLQVRGRSRKPEGDTETRTGLESEPQRCSKVVAHPVGDGLQRIMEDRDAKGPAGLRHGAGRNEVEEVLADANDQGLERRAQTGDPCACGQKRNQQSERRNQCDHRSNWATEPDVGRVAHGIPARVDRLKCLGNSIVPQIAALIFSEIKGYL